VVPIGPLKSRVFWTKHAVAEALEDGFRTEEIEQSMGSLVEMPCFGEEKARGVLRVGGRHCTLLFMRMKAGVRVITCWASSPGEIRDYKRLSRRKPTR